jgi:hypothetical protein
LGLKTYEYYKRKLDKFKYQLHNFPFPPNLIVGSHIPTINQRVQSLKSRFYCFQLLCSIKKLFCLGKYLTNFHQNYDLILTLCTKFFSFFIPWFLFHFRNELISIKPNEMMMRWFIYHQNWDDGRLKRFRHFDSAKRQYGLTPCGVRFCQLNSRLFSGGFFSMFLE